MNKNIKLSIGMIVKNEEENLDKCLTALQPLLKGVNSELIIADTGSSDRTVEIALNYTKQIYYFDWCDDFAKARNYILEKAKGEWFLYIDADEWFEKVDLIIKFLNSQESDGYNDACFILKNYDSFNRSGNFTEEYIKRLFRIMPGRKFQGTIHEYVLQVGQLKFIDEHIIHYGYVQENRDLKKHKKNRRNLPLLLQELEKTPDNLQMLYQLAQEYLCIDNKDKLLETCNKILKKYGDEIDSYYVIKAYWMLNYIYISRGEYSKVIEFADDYLNDTRDYYNIKIMDVLCQAIDVLLKLKEYLKVIKIFKKLFSLLEECDKRILDGEEGYGASVWVQDGLEREKKEFQFAFSLFKCEMYQDSFLHLKCIKGVLGERLIDQNVELWYDILSKTKEYGELYEYYCIIKEYNDKADYVKKIILKIWDGDPDLGIKISQSFLVLPYGDEFVDLIKVYYNLETKGLQAVPDMETLLNTITPMKEYGRLIYLALKYGVSFHSYIEACSHDDIAVLAYQMIENYQLFKGNNADHVINVSLDMSLKEELFNIKMLERRLFDVHLTNEKTEQLFDNYTRDKIRYLRKILREEMLTIQECDSLPGEYCFAVYTDLALQYCEKKDFKNSIHYYRKALKCWPFMKDIISIKTNRIKELIEQNRLDKLEFEQGAIKIKHYIWKMIQEKNLKTAKDTLIAYEKINPKDREIECIRQRLNMESEKI